MDVEKNLPETRLTTSANVGGGGGGGGAAAAAPAPATAAADTEGPPPSYRGSLVQRLQSVKAESTGPGDCIASFFRVLCSSLLATISLGILLVVPLASIIIGAIHLDHCPAERYIPIYLIVSGVFGIAQICLTLSLRIKNQREKKDDENSKPNPLSGIITCFLLAWFIAGSVWVYRTYGRFTTDDPSASDFCDPTVYWFAFVLITAVYVFNALACFCIIGVAAAACIFSA